LTFLLLFISVDFKIKAKFPPSRASNKLKNEKEHIQGDHHGRLSVVHWGQAGTREEAKAKASCYITIKG
jgi:hypothetical protein